MPEFRYSYLVTLIIVVSYIVRADQFNKNQLIMLPQFKWLVVMIVIMFITTLWAVSPEKHLELTIRYIKIVLFGMLAYKMIDTPKKFEQLLGVYILGVFYASWNAREIGRTGYGRLEGVGFADAMDANASAAVVATAIPILLFNILYGRTLWKKVFSLIVLIFSLNCLILYNSRGALIALIIGLVYFGWFTVLEKTSEGIKVKCVLGVILSGLLMLYLADESFWSRMSTLQNLDVETGGGNRIQYWFKTFDLLKDHPLGAGAMGYQILSPNYLPNEWLTGGVRAVHSTWFEVLSEYGYHGLIVFVGYIASSFSLLRKVRQTLRVKGDNYHLFQSVALGGSLLTLLIAVSFINFYYGELMYWLPFYIGAFSNIHLYQHNHSNMSKVS